MGYKNDDSPENRLLELGQFLLEKDSLEISGALVHYQREYLPDLQYETLLVNNKQIFQFLIYSHQHILTCMMRESSNQSVYCVSAYLVLYQPYLLDTIWERCKQKYVPFVGKYCIDPQTAVQFSLCQWGDQGFISLNKVIYMDHENPEMMEKNRALYYKSRLNQVS